jgi:signal transduction histidine kinase/Flp pilus assembly protein TadD
MTMRKIFLITILLLMTVARYSLGQNVDSLYNRFIETSGNRRVTLANEIAQVVHSLECTDTLFHFDNNNRPVLVTAAINELMSSYAVYILNDLTQAVNFSLEAAKLYEQAGDIRAMDLNYSNAAVFYFRKGDYENAIDLMLKCYELQKQLNDPKALSTTLHSLGVAYNNWGNHEMAIEYFRQAVEIERPLNSPMQYALRLSSLAREMSLLGNQTEALRLIKEALSYAEKIERNERIERIAVHQRVMGNIYVEMDSLSQAEECFKHAIAVFEQNNRQQMLAESLLDLGRLQIRQHRLAEAIETLKHCITICEANNLLRIRQDASLFLYEAFKQIEPSTQSLFFLEQYRTLNDSIFKETTQKQIAEFQIKYKIAEKELEIERQQAELPRQKTKQNLVIGGLLIAGLLLVLLVYIILLRNKRNRELAETNATKDKFFSIISHDLKNPTVAQRDALQMLIDYSKEWDTDTVSAYYNELLKSADGQIALLFNLLNWAQVQTGRMPYQPAEFDLPAALRPDIDLIKNAAARKGVTFNCEMPEILIITGDRNMLVTVVRNLLTNAVKFTATGGSVILNISSGGDGRMQYAPTGYAVSVSDTGSGMNAEQIENLFRLDRKTSQKGTAGESGSGLGLIVCRELLEKHGSQLQIESEVGKGSRFWFELGIRN